MTTVEQINKLIAELSEEERNKVFDWYHTFGELYEHRILLLLALIKNTKRWREKSYLHNDFTKYEWYFIVSWYVNWHRNNRQISYHLPIKYRKNCKCEETAKSRERDWHTSQDVLDRLLLV